MTALNSFFGHRALLSAFAWLEGAHRGSPRAVADRSQLPDGQINSLCGFALVQPPSERYFCFSEMQILLYDLPSRPEKRGVGHRHERWDGERWTRRCPRAGEIAGRIYRSVSDRRARRRTALRRTAKACGPDASAVGVKSRGGFESPTGRTKPYSRGDGVKQARSPGRARYRPLKPLRRESRIASAGPVCSCACFLHKFAHETAGAARIRLSLRPLIGEGVK